MCCVDELSASNVHAVLNRSQSTQKLSLNAAFVKMTSLPSIQFQAGVRKLKIQKRKNKDEISHKLFSLSGWKIKSLKKFLPFLG